MFSHYQQHQASPSPARGNGVPVDLEEIREQGRQLGINRFVLQGSKKTVIQAIQHARGEPACFLDDRRFSCERLDCAWRSECLKLTAAWRR
jgi:hypothetical protein